MRYLFLIFPLLGLTLVHCGHAETLSTPATAFSSVVPGRTFSFPQDHMLHGDFQSEWWYVTSNLQGDDGKQYGIQFTLFSNTEMVAKKKYRVFFAHAALSAENNFYYAERYAREDMKHAGVIGEPWQAFIDHWRFSGSGNEPLPGRLEVKEPAFSYSLSLGKAQYFLQGEDGYSQKGASGDMASYYYNAPFIDVVGNIELGGKSIAVKGIAWLDREWSSRLIKFEGLGWDWLSLHLDKNTALMLYRTRDEGVPYLYARLMNKDGSQINIDPKDILWEPKVKRKFGDKLYAIGWRLEIPLHNIELDIKTINENQFLATRVPYWEGVVLGSGSHAARGYLELFGDRD